MSIPRQKDLLLESHEPFRLRFAFEEGQAEQERDSEPVGFGMHGVRLQSMELHPYREIRFNVLLKNRNECSGQDYSLRIGASREDDETMERRAAMNGCSEL